MRLVYFISEKGLCFLKYCVILFQALSIDSKIGYPDYLGSSNLTELETTYEQVEKKRKENRSQNRGSDFLYFI